MKKLLISLLLIGLLAAVVGVGVSAVWTTSAVVDSTFASTGLCITAGVYTVSTGIDAMYPGASETVEYQIFNESPDMSLQFDLSVVLGGVLGSGITPCEVTGYELWNGSAYVPWNAQDAPLAAGGHTYVRITIQMPGAAGNEYMNATGTIEATFDATQV